MVQASGVHRKLLHKDCCTLSSDVIEKHVVLYKSVLAGLKGIVCLECRSCCPRLAMLSVYE